MINKTEEIYRTATPIGNGSHIILPKDWEGSKVILTKAGIDPKKEILELLYSHLRDIVGIYLYGSYARKENKENSDIDVAVITDKKIKIESKKPFDIIQIKKDNLDDFKKINPILFYSILFESEPIINSSFLEDFRKKQIKKNDFKEYINETSRVININKELLNLDKSQKQEYIDNELVYSLILRLRGLYIIESLFKKEKFSNNSFLKFLRNKLANNPQPYYEVYQNVRNNKKTKKQINVEETEKLLSLLNNLLNSIALKINNAK